MKKIPTEGIGAYIAEITPAIDRVIKKTEETYTAHEIIEALVLGKMTLWQDPRGYVVTEVCGDVYNIGICVGVDIDGWIDEIIAVTKADAKKQNCRYIQEIGRRGWVKKMARFGFKEKGTIMRCELWAV